MAKKAAKKKAKPNKGGEGGGTKPGEGSKSKEVVTATAKTPTDYGDCPDCGKSVPAVVRPFQVVGNGLFVCVPCKATRMRDKLEAEITSMVEAEKKAKTAILQGVLEFPV